MFKLFVLFYGRHPFYRVKLKEMWGHFYILAKKINNIYEEILKVMPWVKNKFAVPTLLYSISNHFKNKNMPQVVKLKYS